MVIIVGNAISDLSSNCEQGCLHFTLCLCPWERHESISSLSISWFLQPLLNNLWKQRKIEFKSGVLNLQIDLVSYFACSRAVVTPYTHCMISFYERRINNVVNAFGFKEWNENWIELNRTELNWIGQNGFLHLALATSQGEWKWNIYIIYFYFRLIPNFNSGRVKKTPNDPTCELTNTQIDIWGKKFHK